MVMKNKILMNKNQQKLDIDNIRLIINQFVFLNKILNMLFEIIFKGTVRNNGWFILILVG